MFYLLICLNKFIKYEDELFKTNSKSKTRFKRKTKIKFVMSLQ